MTSFAAQAANRRKFLQFLAASPLWAAGGFSAFAGEAARPGTKLPDPLMWAPLNPERLIKSPKEAINVFDFEPVMRANVPPAHFGYMASGIDDEVTLRRNREDFLKFVLRPSTRRARSPPPAPPRSATTCRSSRPPPPLRPRTSPPRAARRSGTSSTPPTSGRSRRPS